MLFIASYKFNKRLTKVNLIFVGVGCVTGSTNLKKELNAFTLLDPQLLPS